MSALYLHLGQPVAYQAPGRVAYGEVNALAEGYAQLRILQVGQPRYLWVARSEILGESFRVAPNAGPSDLNRRQFEGHYARTGHLLEGYYPLDVELPMLVRTCACGEVAR